MSPVMDENIPFEYQSRKTVQSPQWSGESQEGQGQENESSACKGSL